MKLPGIDETVLIEKEAMPVFLAGGSSAVLLLHGYLGSPEDVIYLGRKLNSSGFTVSIPRLPGHGSSGIDLLTSGSRDWLRKVFDTYAELKSSCSRVYIAGFSLGGLLAIAAASVFKPAGLILIAPAITNKRRLKIHFAPFVMLFSKKIRRKNLPDAVSDFDKKLREEYWSHDWPSSAYDILKLQKEAVKRLKIISCPTLLLLSEKDRTVPLRASEIINNHINREIIEEARLKNSGHIIFKGPDKEEAAEIVNSWISRIDNR